MAAKTKKPKNKSIRQLSKQQDLTEIKSINELCSQDSIATSNLQYFKELPISNRTKQGLQHANFVDMTDIQKSSYSHALCGKDVLGAAKTGSGKTLAFLVPVIECLYREKWGPSDGLGALIISPTRELALQIFGVLRKIGKFHTLSAGLVIGGKDVEYERERINRMNILVATPGRLLHHMDSTPNFDCSNIQVLVLDEADRILDMGFKQSVNAIIDNLPITRQTLLFSATQTKSVSDLARLSLKDPEYVAVHEKADKSTPDSLVQNYLVCELYEKLDILFSFLKTHLKSKILIFLSSCKQVRFAHETFCKLQPGIVLMCLHGKQKQEKRNIMFEKFSRSKYAAMFCTDIAARGLDFPAIDWVVQVDCPEDGDTYIHRVGRTARFNSNGRALLFLAPSEEEGMVDLFEKKKIPITKIAVNPKHTSSVIPSLQAFCAQDPEMKYLGERAFICYMRSLWLNKNKNVFDVTKLPLEEFASSLGLPGAPKIKFVRRLKDQKNKDMASQKKSQEIVADTDEEDSEDDDVPKKNEFKTKADRMFAKKNQSILSSHYEKHRDRDESDVDKNAENEENVGEENEDEDDFLKIARKDHDLEDVPHSAPTFHERPLSVRDKRNMKLKNRIGKMGNESSRTKIEFDDDGNPHLSWKLETESEFLNDGDGVIAKHQKYLQAISEVMQEADKDDKALHKERLREKRRRQKVKERGGSLADGQVEEAVVTLGNSEDEGEYDDNISNDNYDEFEDEQEQDFYSEDDDGDFEHEEEVEKHGKVRKRFKSAASELDIKAQEELALKLLSSQ